MKNCQDRSSVSGDARHGRPTILFISSFLYLGIISPVLSAEPISTATVFSSAEYHLHSVTLQGTVTQIRPAPPHLGRYCRIEGSYRFTLEDATGAIEVEVPGTCLPFSPATAVAEGDHIRLDALIHRFIRDADRQLVVIATVQRIW